MEEEEVVEVAEVAAVEEEEEDQPNPQPRNLRPLTKETGSWKEKNPPFSRAIEQKPTNLCTNSSCTNSSTPLHLS